MTILETAPGAAPSSWGRGGRRRRSVSPRWASVLAVIVVAGVAVLALLSPSAAIAALLVLTIAVVLSLVPKTGLSYLLAFIIVLFLIPSTLTVAGPLKGIGQPSTILGWGAGVLWIAGRLHPQSGLDRSRNPARWTVLFFLTVVVLAFGVAYTRPLTHVEIQGTYRSVAKLASYAGMGLLTMDCLRDRRDVNRLLMGLVFGVLFSAVVGLIQFRTGFNYVQKVHLPGLSISRGSGGGSIRQGLHRVRGTADHPIEFAVTLTATLPLALHYAMYLGKSRLRTTFRVATVVLAVAVPAAISRTGTVGIVIALVVVAAGWSWRRRMNVLAVAVVSGVVAAAVFPRLLGTVRSLFANFSGKDSIKGRTKDYTNVQPFLHGHLLFGRGQGTFQVGQYFTLDNQYLGTLLSSGVVGVTALALLYLSIIFLGRGVRRRGRDAADRSLGQALTASGVVLAFSAGTFDLFGFTQALALTFMLLGVAGALWRITWYENPRWEIPRVSTRVRDTVPATSAE